MGPSVSGLNAAQMKPPVPHKIHGSYSIVRNHVAGPHEKHARMGRVVNYTERINRIIVFRRESVRSAHT
jgi:hypothetical protein